MNHIVYRMLSGERGARRELRLLTRQTAQVFGETAPKAAGRSVSERLESYARFTADAAGRALDGGQDLARLDGELYRMAERLGDRARRRTAPRDHAECLALLTTLYRNIGIVIREEDRGAFCVGACYFSAFYTPEVCAVISAIDRGIFAGIFAGGDLTFHARITEGQETCRANFIDPRDAVGESDKTY